LRIARFYPEKVVFLRGIARLLRRVHVQPASEGNRVSEAFEPRWSNESLSNEEMEMSAATSRTFVEAGLVIAILAFGRRVASCSYLQNRLPVCAGARKLLNASTIQFNQGFHAKAEAYRLHYLGGVDEKLENQ
jgi:hypothetical protein